MRAAALAVVCALALGGCSLVGDDDGDDNGADDPAAGNDENDSGCPVDPGRVGELLGYEVVVADSKDGAAGCRFEPAPAAAADHPGAEVRVAVRRLAEDGFTAAMAAVESSAGPVEPFGDDGVDHADRGWVARVGRVVQVGAARDRDLVQVTVVDAALDGAAAEEVARELAGQALDG